MTGALAWITKWAVLILLVIVIARTEIGNRLIYYMLWLSVLLLVVTNADAISSIITGTSSTPT